jgi:hypothetical protein
LADGIDHQNWISGQRLLFDMLASFERNEEGKIISGPLTKMVQKQYYSVMGLIFPYENFQTAEEEAVDPIQKLLAEREKVVKMLAEQQISLAGPGVKA